MLQCCHFTSNKAFASLAPKGCSSSIDLTRAATLDDRGVIEHLNALGWLDHRNNLVQKPCLFTEEYHTLPDNPRRIFIEWLDDLPRIRLCLRDVECG